MWKFWKKSKPAPETPAQRAERLRRALKFDPETGRVEITQEYRDACIDEIMDCGTAK